MQQPQRQAKPFVTFTVMKGFACFVTGVSGLDFYCLCGNIRHERLNKTGKADRGWTVRHIKTAIFLNF